MRLVWLLLLLLGTAGATYAQDVKCADELSQADAVYLEGRFDETVRLLRACLDRETLFVEEAISVYRLLIMAHLNQDETDEAQAAIADLLVLAPDYKADPIQDPPSYVALVTTQREQVVRQQEAQRLAESEEETLPVEAEQEQAVEETRRVLDPPPVIEQEEAGQAPQGVPQRQTTTFFERPKSWLIAGGGALVIFAALGLAVGGPDTGGQ